MTAAQGKSLTHSSQLAYVGADGHVYTQQAPQKQAERLTWSFRELSYGVWQNPDQVDRLRYFWPTWSPTGDRLACVGIFGRGDRELGSGVYVYDTVKGVESWELWAGASGSPIYLQWSPDGSRLSTVVQQNEALNLMLANLKDGNGATTVLSGMPLFHAYSPDSSSMSIHLGGRFNGQAGRRLYRIELDSPEQRLTLTEHPSNFGTPSWSDDGRFLAFALEENNLQTLCLTEYPLGPYQRLGRYVGSSALSWEAGGQSLLVAISPDHTHRMFEQLWRYPVDGGEPSLLLEDRLIGCYPLSGGRLLYLRPDLTDQSFSWRMLEASGRSRTLASFYPSKPQSFMCSFFHQFSLSHPLLSPDRRYLVHAGYPSRREKEDNFTLPRIFLLDLEKDDDAFPIAEGSMACWSAARGE